MERGEERSLLFKSQSPGDRQRGKYNYPLKLRQKMDQEHRKTGEAEEDEEGAESGEKGETNRANVLGEEGAAAGQGPAAVPQGRRATVSAGVELARFRTGQQTAARNQTRATHSQRWVGEGRGEGGQRNETERGRQRERERKRQGKWRTERERDKERGRKRGGERGRAKAREG